MEAIEVMEATRQLMAEGKHKEAREFIVTHFRELPEDLQGDLLIEFIKEAAAPRRMVNMATEAGDAAMRVLDRIEAAEKHLEELKAAKDT